jgi:hypothetical protein
MTNPKVSIATLAPFPPAPSAPQGPTLPAPPSHLQQGAAGLGPLPGASITVATLPHRYMMAGIIPVVAAVVLTLLGLFISWPASGAAIRP